MDKQTFVYVISISTTPERLWVALTTGDLTQQYWSNQRIQSDWKIGSPVKHLMENGQAEWEGLVLQHDPFRVLSYTMMGEQGPQRLAFQLEPVGETVKLTLSHYDLPPTDFELVSTGWPGMMSSLKTLLETGKPDRSFRPWSRSV